VSAPAQAAGAAILEADGLHVRMGVQEILRGVSVRVPAGGVVCVLGANGVGKTSLMRTISGVYQPNAGQVRFDGQVITGLPSHAIVGRGLAQAPEGRQIFSNMSVRENLLLGAITQKGEAARHIDDTLADMLQRFPILSERFGQQAGSLSGGEQQMLCIARALMSRPKLLLLDEPSLGLAPKVVARIFQLIGEIRAAGTSILIVEQNVRAALKVADHGYVMEGGRVVIEGSAAMLRDDPRIQAAYLGGHAS
jgi:branched-chain amino acid transport system ATP-binding protein